MAEVAMGLYESATYLEDVERCAAKVAAFGSPRGASALVTGATGLIGSFLVDALLASGVRVVAACRSQKRALARFGGCPFGFPELGYYDAALPIKELPSTDYVIHAASNAHPASMLADPTGTVVANVVGTANLLKWCETNGVARMLYVSSGVPRVRRLDGTEVVLPRREARRREYLCCVAREDEMRRGKALPYLWAHRDRFR